MTERLTQQVTCPACGREVPATLGVIGVHDRKKQIPGRSESWWLCPGTGRKVALARDPRDTAPRGCIAYLTVGGEGRICGAPAPILDPQRGGMVCRLHQPELPSYLSISPEGTLYFDVPAFILEAGLLDTPEIRDSVAEISAQVAAKYWPESRVEIRR